MTMFVVHPVILAISFICAVAYSVVLKGLVKRQVKFNSALLITDDDYCCPDQSDV